MESSVKDIVKRESPCMLVDLIAKILVSECNEAKPLKACYVWVRAEPESATSRRAGEESEGHSVVD